ncbi:hypothetical protein [Methanocella paludicola]|nr:hypothetical protein [Methanocella paludicola]
MIQNCGCHEECCCGMEAEDEVQMLELKKKMLQVRVKAIDRKIVQLKENEKEAGS